MKIKTVAIIALAMTSILIVAAAAVVHFNRLGRVHSPLAYPKVILHTADSPQVQTCYNFVIDKMF